MDKAITDDEFKRLINGPLDHPLYPFKITRLILALRHVVEVTGPAGAEALRQACRQRTTQDEGENGR